MALVGWFNVIPMVAFTTRGITVHGTHINHRHFNIGRWSTIAPKRTFPRDRERESDRKMYTSEKKSEKKENRDGKKNMREWEKERMMEEQRRKRDDKRVSAFELYTTNPHDRFEYTIHPQPSIFQEVVTGKKYFLFHNP